MKFGTNQVYTKNSSHYERKSNRMLAKLFHHEYVTVTTTYTGPYRETWYAYLNAANQLKLATSQCQCDPYNDASATYTQPATTWESSEACRETSGCAPTSYSKTANECWDWYHETHTQGKCLTLPARARLQRLWHIDNTQGDKYAKSDYWPWQIFVSTAVVQRAQCRYHQRWTSLARY
jgi:hypothetical protein